MFLIFHLPKIFKAQQFTVKKIKKNCMLFLDFCNCKKSKFNRDFLKGNVINLHSLA